MAPVVVSASELSKRYRLGTSTAPYGRLTESLSEGISNLFSRKKRESTRRAPEYVWALRDVSFEVEEGDVIGIIGRNGAGKTTLLKILSRITEPTTGEARIKGRVGSLLEVGAGFHHELTGRENILLNGTILGMRSKEIERRFDEIVAFAEVDRFIDTPVKRYSSGMLVRLAFAVAAHLEPDVLIVDEVLAVGDAAFQKKCLGRMGEVGSSGRTVIFVSHNMGAVRSLCRRGIVLKDGGMTFDGSATDAVGAYMSEVGHLEGGGELAWAPDDSNRPQTEDVTLNAIRLIGPTARPQSVFDTDAPIRVEIDYEILRPIRGTRFVLAVQTAEGEIAFRTTDHRTRPENDLPGHYKSWATIPPRLLNRRNYLVILSFEVPGVRYIFYPKEYLSFSVSGVGQHGSSFPERWEGVVAPPIEWQLEQLSSADGGSPRDVDDEAHRLRP